MSSYFKFMLASCFIGCFATNYGQEHKRPLTLAESCAIGAGTAIGEVIFPGQQCSYAMNQAIKQKPFVPAHCCQGLVANAGGAAPACALQKMVQAKGSQIVEGTQNSELSDRQKIMLSYVAGVGGAVAETPCNAWQLYAQEGSNKGRGLIQAIQELGMKSFRGFGPNALLKEGPFTVGYQVLSDQAEKTVQKYTDSPMTAKVIGGISAGVVVAGITQPGAVLRNTMQADLFNPAYHQRPDMMPTTRETVRAIIKKYGVAGLWAGLKQRGSRIAIAIPLYAAYSAILEKQVRKQY